MRFQSSKITPLSRELQVLEKIDKKYFLFCFTKYVFFADVFDKDGSGDVDFTEFLQGLSTFGSKAEKTEKLR